MMRKLRFLLPAMLAATLLAHGQEFIWNIDLASEFDNREYKSDFNSSQTLFGVRATPEVGLGWKCNQLKAGLTYINEFGAPSYEFPTQIVVYYNWNDHRHYSVSGGVIPRNQSIARYSRAFFSDSVRFYDPNIGGLLAQIYGQRGYFEFACDWDSRQSIDRREKFTLFSAGELRLGPAFGGYNFSMHHHAGTMLAEGVTDNIWIYPYAGVNLRRQTGADSLFVSVGWLQTSQHDRTYDAGYRNRGGVQIEALVKKWGLGVYNTLYLGPSLMPYYHSYGASLYWGDSFYSTTKGVYDRLELYWEPVVRKDMRLKVSSVHHYDGNRWGWQQMVSFAVDIGSGMFKK
ncbi:hypothetical protein FACS1894159_01540 [Bacteroidia bacterium]|nr:hypothetical protein FACS1894159_01540 [Bacteroidia bacterium]